MRVNQKMTGRASSMPAGLALGAAFSMGMTLLGALVLAKLVDAEKLAWENIGYGIMIVLLLAAFLGASVAYGRIKHQRMMVCALSGVLYFALLLSITALFFGGQYDGVGVTAALVLGGSMTAGLLGLRQGRGGKRRKIRTSHR